MKTSTNKTAARPLTRAFTNLVQLHFSPIKKSAALLSICLAFLAAPKIHSQTLVNSGTSAGNFETGGTLFSAAGWSTANPASRARWYLGTFIDCGGTQAAYITTSGSGTNNSYSLTGGSNLLQAHLYRSIVFPPGIGASAKYITLTFSWRGNAGLANSAGMHVYIGSPGGPNPVASVPFFTTDPSAIRLNTTMYSQVGACTSVTLTLPEACAGTTRNLVFSWEQANSSGTAATTLDNISLVAAATTLPSCATSLLPATASTISKCNPVLSWAPNSTAAAAPTSYDLYFGTSPVPPLLTNTTSLSYALDVLNPSTVYYWKVVPKNAAGSAIGCATSSFTTTAAACLASPGGVGLNNLTGWFKADGLAPGNLVSWTTSYSSISPITVTDTSSFNYPQVTNSTAAGTDIYNYNQYISFAGNSATWPNQKFLLNTASIDLMSNSNNKTDESSFFTVFQTDDVDPLTTPYDDHIAYWMPSSGNSGMQCRAFGRFAIGSGIGWTDLSSQEASAAQMDNYASVFSYTGNRSSNTSMASYYNGTASTTCLQVSEAQGTVGLAFGMHLSSLAPFLSEPFIGSSAEHIFFDATLRPAQVDRVHTYLAVKYGTTLTTDYFASNNSLIYDNVAPYDNDIIGLGRDDNSGLTQKQSHNSDDSVRFYAGTLATTNAANSSAFSVDKSFVIIGANTGQLNSTTASQAAKPVGIYSRLERQWKVTKTNYAQTFSMDVSLSSSGTPMSVMPADLRLLVSATGNFSTATVYAAGGGLTFSYNFPYITVSGISVTQIPNNSTQFITIASVNPLTPLPVGFTSFAANCSNADIVLNWSAASQGNAKNFVPERSYDGTSFTPIAQINAMTGASSASYSYTDNNLPSGTYYYRVKETNNNGSVQYSKTISINQGCGNSGANLSGLNIYPNPIKEKEVQFVYTAAKEENVIAKFSNTLGEVIYQQSLHVHTGKNTSTISLDKLSEGVYFMQIQSTSGNSNVAKMMVSHQP